LHDDRSRPLAFGGRSGPGRRARRVPLAAIPGRCSGRWSARRSWT